MLHMREREKEGKRGGRKKRGGEKGDGRSYQQCMCMRVCIYIVRVLEIGQRLTLPICCSRKNIENHSEREREEENRREWKRGKKSDGGGGKGLKAFFLSILDDERRNTIVIRAADSIK